MNSKAIIEKARSLGASLAGIASTASLENSPSYQVSGKVKWPAEAKSVLVLVLEHKENDPELDWWGVPGGTRGNQRLKKISIGLKKCLKKEFNINARTLPYQLADGGIFLKDAAALAGLGIIGANNLLITPKFGPCTRLRALFLEKELTPTGAIDFSPCDTCNKPCWQA
jgi:epoxyqueuosine reductase